MRFPISAVERVIRDNIGQKPGGQIPVAWRALGPLADADTIEADQLGQLLAEAVAPGLGVTVAAVTLVGVEISAGAFLVALDAADAIDHPLVAAWLPETLGEAIAAPLLWAASLAALAPGRPIQRYVDFLDRGDMAPRGLASFEVETVLGMARVVAYYGAGDDPAHVASYRLNGPALAVAGWSLSTGERSAAATNPLGDLQAAVPASAVRH